MLQPAKWSKWYFWILITWFWTNTTINQQKQQHYINLWTDLTDNPLTTHPMLMDWEISIEPYQNCQFGVYWQPGLLIMKGFGLDPNLDLKRQSRTVANTTCVPIEHMQHQIKKAGAAVLAEKQPGVELPWHYKLTAAIERHLWIIHDDQLRSCLSSQDGTTRNLQLYWRHNGMGAHSPRTSAISTCNGTSATWCESGSSKFWYWFCAIRICVFSCFSFQYSIFQSWSICQGLQAW